MYSLLNVGKRLGDGILDALISHAKNGKMSISLTIIIYIHICQIILHLRALNVEHMLSIAAAMIPTKYDQAWPLSIARYDNQNQIK